MKKIQNSYRMLFLLYLFLLVFSSGWAQKAKAWMAPESANEVKNPLANDPQAPIEGKKIFTSVCVVCHGESGKGNGAAGVALDPHPANFLSEHTRKESDGALFWKMTEGRPPMAPYKTQFTETQRWQLVTYIRKLEEKK